MYLSNYDRGIGTILQYFLRAVFRYISNESFDGVVDETGNRLIFVLSQIKLSNDCIVFSCYFC